MPGKWRTGKYTKLLFERKIRLTTYVILSVLVGTILAYANGMPKDYYHTIYEDAGESNLTSSTVEEGLNRDTTPSSSARGLTSDSFTNEYGTPTTKCAHSGCNNYIASSGDTNCCVEHSNKCLSCGKYIDEDAMYCMNCLSSSGSSNHYSDSYSSGNSSGSASKGSSSSTAGGPGKCKYKIGSQYVCSKPATHGDLCDEHFAYLDDIYNSMAG